MDSEFNRKILDMNREILALKQQREKSANVLHTISAPITLTFDLEIAGQFDVYVRSDKMAVISIDSGDNNPLMNLSFDISSLDDRLIRHVPIYDESTGKVGFMVFIYSYNQQDLDTLEGGGSVTLTYDATITATANITPTITYSDLWVN